MNYTVHATTRGNGVSVASVKRSQIEFDSSPTQGEQLPGPADLLTAAFAACVLKNVERFGAILGFDWQHATIDVTSQREDAPPKIGRITYRLEIVTHEPPRRVQLLHKNIARHGTIYNTLAASCEISGEIVAIDKLTQ